MMTACELEIVGIPPMIDAPKINRKPKRKNTCNHWQIDKLYNAGVIDSDQHYAGVHIRFWREMMQSSHLKAMCLEDVRGGMGDAHAAPIGRLDAQSHMSKLIIAIKNRETDECRAMLWASCVWVAIDDMSLSDAVKMMGVRKKNGIEHVLYSLTALYEELEHNELLFWQRDVK